MVALGVTVGPEQLVARVALVVELVQLVMQEDLLPLVPAL